MSEQLAAAMSAVNLALAALLLALAYKVLRHIDKCEERNRRDAKSD